MCHERLLTSGHRHDATYLRVFRDLVSDTDMLYVSLLDEMQESNPLNDPYLLPPVQALVSQPSRKSQLHHLTVQFQYDHDLLAYDPGMCNSARLRPRIEYIALPNHLTELKMCLCARGHLQTLHPPDPACIPAYKISLPKYDGVIPTYVASQSDTILFCLTPNPRSVASSLTSSTPETLPGMDLFIFHATAQIPSLPAQHLSDGHCKHAIRRTISQPDGVHS